MKKLVSLLLALAMLPGLAGCGSVYSNYREMEQLLVLQTMGLDSAAEGIRLSLASGADSARGTEPVRLAVTSPTVSAAFDEAQNYSFEESLFFAHINTLLVGEGAAKRGLGDELNFICQAPRIRIDIPIYIVKNGDAADVIMDTGGTGKGVAEILMGVREYLEKRGGGIFTAADIVRDSLRYGSALVCALEYAPSVQDGAAPAESGADAEVGNEDDMPPQEDGAQDGEDTGADEDEGSAGADSNAQDAQDGSGNSASPSPSPDGGENGEAAENGGRRTAAAAGYAVLKDMKLCAYIGLDEALGVDFLINRVSKHDVTVTDRRGNPVTLEINSGGCDITPQWNTDGSLRRIDVKAAAHAAVLEMNGEGSMDDAAYSDYLTAQLEGCVSERISAVLRLSQELGADFIPLAAAVEASDAAAFAALGAPFEELLPGLEIRVSVKGQITHSSDLRRTL